MRNSRLVVLLLLLFIGTACSDSGPIDITDESDVLIGFWEGTDVTFSINTQFFQDGNSFSRTCTSSFVNSDYLIEFKADPKTFLSNGDFYVETICDDLDPYFEQFSLFGDGRWELMDSELQFRALTDEPNGIIVPVTFEEIDADNIILTAERVQNFVDGSNYATSTFTVVVQLSRQ